MSFANCPSGDQLKAFSIGDLSQDTIHEIAEHLAICKRCDGQIKRFDSHSDELLRTLQDLPQGFRAKVASESAGSNPVDVVEQEQEGNQVLLDPGRAYSIRLAHGRVQVGKFSLEQELGAGSFGYVFKALDTELDRTVAIKIQRAGKYGDSDDVQQFIREAKSAARLAHPAIVSVFETGQTEEGVCYLVTEFVDGQTLQQALSRASIPFRKATEYLIALADALDYAHRHDVVHRDVKPSNIILDHDGQIHLMDFGLAKRIAADDTVTDDGQVMGTPAYMSPEQARGQSQEADARSDVYSLGVVMYEMLTGQQPFQGKKRLLLLQLLEDDPRPPRQLNDVIPRDLEVICLKAMCKLPRLRYQTADHMSADLKRFLAGEPIVARPLGYVERFLRWSRRYPTAVAAFLALLIGSVAAVLYLSQLSQYLVRETASDSAHMQSQMLDSINEYYAQIVKELDIYLQENRGSLSSEELESRLHDRTHGVVPVPARFTIELGHKLQSSDAVQVRLYSNYPFPKREDGGPQDAFGDRAIEKLEANPQTPVVEFTDLNGRPVVRYATARIMQESCVDCHNTRADSPKRDWKVGDVRGVLEVIRPLERDQMRTRRGLGNAITWIIAIVTLLTAFVSSVVFATTRKKND